MANFGELQTKLIQRVARNSPELIAVSGQCLNESVKRICKKHNFWFMKTSYEETITAPTQQYALQPYFKESDVFYFSQTDSFVVIEKISIEDALRHYSPTDTGPPERYIEEGGVITILPIPDTTYHLVETYYQFMAPMANNEDTNYLTENFDELVLYGGIAEAFDFLQEKDDFASWDAKFTRGINELVAMNNAKILSGEITLTPKTDTKASVLTTRNSGFVIKGYY